MLENGCEVHRYGPKKLIPQSDSSILTTENHEGIYKEYTPGDPVHGEDPKLIT